MSTPPTPRTTVKRQPDRGHYESELIHAVLDEGLVAHVGLATDDAHNHFGRGGSSPGRGWVMVRSKHLTAESLILAMEKGFQARVFSRMDDADRWLRFGAD